MTTVTLPESTLARAQMLAESEKLTVQQYLIKLVANQSMPAIQYTHEERENAWQEMIDRAKARADRYPPGFKVDDSRESIYQEREDAQL